MNKDAFMELATLYFKRYTEEERREIRIDFLIQADKKTAKAWSMAEKSEIPPELNYLIREKFFRFFMIRQKIGINF